MKFLILLAEVCGLVQGQQCNADNCARAVTGTIRGLPAQSSAKKDCESFFKVTVSPATSTATATVSIFPFATTIIRTTGTIVQTYTVYPVTTTLFVTTNTQLETTTVETTTDIIATETVTATLDTITILRRATSTTRGPSTIRPSSVPPYASPCSGTVRYSSACSCFGATRTTITLATPTTTTTRTITGTSTIIRDVIATQIQTLSLTSTVTSLVDYTITSDATLTETATATETLPVTAIVDPVGLVCSTPQRGCQFAPLCPGRGACKCITTDLGPRCIIGNVCGDECTTTADCPSGEVCTFDTCCGSSGGFCAVRGTECLNTVLVSRIFGRTPAKIEESARAEFLTPDTGETFTE